MTEKIEFYTRFLSIDLHQINEMDRWCNANIGLAGFNWNRYWAYAAVAARYDVAYKFNTTEHKFQFDLSWPN